MKSVGIESGRGIAAGFVLAGGASRRMGASKPLLPFQGSTLVEYILGQVAAVTRPVRIVGGRQQLSGLKVEIVDDLFPGEGPLGGVITALQNSESEWNLIVACDMPAISSSKLRELVDRAVMSDCDALIPVTPDGHRHPLCAVYRRTAAGPLAAAREEGIRRLQTALSRLRIEVADSKDPAVFANVNTPAEWDVFAGALH